MNDRLANVVEIKASGADGSSYDGRVGVNSPLLQPFGPGVGHGCLGNLTAASSLALEALTAPLPAASLPPVVGHAGPEWQDNPSFSDR